MVNFLIHIFTLVAIYGLIAISFNLAMGYTGLVNLGHVGLMGIGAYVSAILTTKFGFSFFPAFVLAGISAAVFGALLALPSRRIKDDYFALLTLGFMFVTSAVFINWTSLTRGTLGVRGIMRPEGFTDPFFFFILVLLVLAVAYIILNQTVSSPFGRVLEAIRDDEQVAESLGKNVERAKITAMALSGFFVGLSGSLLAHFLRLINPGTFWLDPLVLALAAVVIGGLASLRGSLVGVILVFVISESLRFFAIPSSLIGPLRVMIFMAVLVIIVLWRPKGLLGRADLD
ncbi:branched-chain amino acid ABC transporter permease [Candidatus Uhrbacteria bacterium]|nr:branched-chain amino acid ABC transporter permease [Candidatus Uhrbacteria bacterium]